MSTHRFEFSVSQWHAVAAMRMLGRPLSADVLAVLAKLLPSKLNELITRGIEMNYIREAPSGCHIISSKLADAVQTKLSSVCTPDLADTFLDRLLKSDLPEAEDMEIQASLYYWSGKITEAATIENEIGYKALEKGHLGKALTHFEQTLAWIPSPGEDLKQQHLFTSAVLQLSHLRFCSGEGLNEIPELLNMAQQAAVQRKDTHTNVLLELHKVRHICHENRFEEAIETSRKALDIAKTLGDDFQSLSTEFTGVYYFFKGMHKEALTFFEEAFQRVELNQDRPVAFLIPHWLGLCAAYTGQFHRAIGVFDTNFRRAQYRSEPALADHFRSDLGIVLLIAGKTDEAYRHLSEMLEGAKSRGNRHAILWGKIGIAYFHYLENRPREAHQLMQEAVTEAMDHNCLFRQYTWPWFLEMLYGFNRLKYGPLPAFDYESELETKAGGSNVMLRGVALRLKAKEAIFQHNDSRKVAALFKRSEQYLRQSGNPIELGKTLVEIARFKLRKKQFESAWNYSLMARESLTGVNPALFPPDLRPALERKVDQPVFYQPPPADNHLDKIIDALDKLILSHNVDSFLQRVLSIVGNFFGAARGAVFWKDAPDPKKAAYKVGYNLSEEESLRQDFRNSLLAIQKTFRQNSTILIRKALKSARNLKTTPLAVLCMPLEIDGQVKGVFYYDNAYDEKAFDRLSGNELDVLCQYMGRLISCVTTYFEGIMASSYEKAVQTSTAGHSPGSELKAESPIMKKLLSLADKAADSDASILILGETGVGKELLAQRLHRMNRKRGSGPFHVVDVSNIAESLIESELFGYEKGAFTGADQRKLGRLELSNGGTLFIDEIGNIPLTIQSKLLRALQEKSVVRVGGTNTVKTDFRLLAATNQDLEQDVLLGRFRADLFYRINVVPIKVPPLRDRGDDILLLANHFLKHFSKKHGKTSLQFSEKAQANFLQYHWPGNIRELKNVVECAVLLSSDNLLGTDLFPKADINPAGNPFEDLPTMDELQQRYISYVLDITNGRISGKGGAAEVLGMKRTTLAARMKKLGVHKYG